MIGASAVRRTKIAARAIAATRIADVRTLRSVWTAGSNDARSEEPIEGTRAARGLAAKPGARKAPGLPGRGGKVGVAWAPDRARRVGRCSVSSCVNACSEGEVLDSKVVGGMGRACVGRGCAVLTCVDLICADRACPIAVWAVRGLGWGAGRRGLSLVRPASAGRGWVAAARAARGTGEATGLVRVLVPGLGHAAKDAGLAVRSLGRREACDAISAGMVRKDLVCGTTIADPAPATRCAIAATAIATKGPRSDASGANLRHAIVASDTHL